MPVEFEVVAMVETMVREVRKRGRAILMFLGPGGSQSEAGWEQVFIQCDWRGVYLPSVYLHSLRDFPTWSLLSTQPGSRAISLGTLYPLVLVMATVVALALFPCKRSLVRVWLFTAPKGSWDGWFMTKAVTASSDTRNSVALVARRDQPGRGTTRT